MFVNPSYSKSLNLYFAEQIHRAALNFNLISRLVIALLNLI